jgi:hypothetical protein
MKNEKWNGMRWGEWMKVRNGANLQCLQKLSNLMTTYSWRIVKKTTPTKKYMYEWSEDEVIRNDNEVLWR